MKFLAFSFKRGRTLASKEGEILSPALLTFPFSRVLFRVESPSPSLGGLGLLLIINGDYR